MVENVFLPAGLQVHVVKGFPIPVNIHVVSDLFSCLFNEQVSDVSWTRISIHRRRFYSRIWYAWSLLSAASLRNCQVDICGQRFSMKLTIEMIIHSIVLMS